MGTKSTTTTVKHLRAKFSGRCVQCGQRFPVGAEIAWVKADRYAKPVTYHDACFAGLEEVAPGVFDRPAPLVAAFNAGDAQHEAWRSEVGQVLAGKGGSRRTVSGPADPRGWDGEKGAQWVLYAISQEHWDGEPEIRAAAAQRFHEAWRSGTWRSLVETEHGVVAVGSEFGRPSRSSR